MKLFDLLTWEASGPLWDFDTRSLRPKESPPKKQMSKKLKKISIYNKNLVGVIVGKAIYENRLQVDQVINFLSDK